MPHQETLHLCIIVDDGKFVFEILLIEQGRKKTPLFCCSIFA